MADDKNQEDSENFGLPDIEYKPLEQLDSSKSQEETAPVKDSSTSETPPPYYEEEEEEGSKSGVIITLIVGLVIVVGGFLAYKYIWVPKQEKAKLALLEEKRKVREKALADSTARVGCFKFCGWRPRHGQSEEVERIRKVYQDHSSIRQMEIF